MLREVLQDVDLSIERVRFELPHQLPVGSVHKTTMQWKQAVIQHAQNTRAVTGRRCPHCGVGEDFLARRPFFFYENGRNLETKTRKIDAKVN